MPPSFTKPQPHPQPRAGVLNIEMYQPGQAEVGGQAIRLASNENPLGCSEAAQEALRQFATTSLYPPDGTPELVAALARVHDLEPEGITIGAGSTELLHRLAQTFAGPGDEILFSQYGFLVYGLVTHMAGATPVRAPARALTYEADVEALVNHVSERTKIVFLDNPNNPTGTTLPLEKIQYLHKNLPPHVLLVLDHAYAEYHGPAASEAYLKMAAEADNIMVVRTLSKAYGLAAARVGWGYGAPQLVEHLWRTHLPFHITGQSHAMALAALEDQNFVLTSVAENQAARDYFMNQLTKMDIKFLHSQANFICVHFGAHAMQVHQRLASHKIFVRPIAGYGLPEFLRISIGRLVDMERVVAVLKQILAEV